MKKMLSLLFVLILSVPIFGQSQSLSVIPQNKNGFHGNIEKRHHLHRKGNKSENQIKSTALVVMRMDSMIYQEETLNTSILEKSYKEEYTYSNAGEVMTEIYSTWGGSLGWIPEDKVVYTYGSGAKVLEEEWSTWDDIYSQWFPADKNVYTYDVSGEVSTILNYTWNASISQWVNAYKREFSYNTASELIQLMEYYWDQLATSWIPANRSDYSYLANGLLLESIEAYWEPSSSLWIFSVKQVHDYNMNGDPVTVTDYTYDEMSSQWVPWHKEEIAYNAQGKIEQIIESYYDIFMLQWAYGWKEGFQWATNGDLLERQNFFYESAISSWVPSSKENMAYDTLFGFWDILIPAYYREDLGHYFNHMLLQVNGMSFDGSVWYSDYLVDLHYSPMNITGFPETEKTSVSIYPNPTPGFLRLEFRDHAIQGQIEVLDMQGQLVMSTAVHNHSELDISMLPSGLYFYRINTQQTNITGKLIKI